MKRITSLYPQLCSFENLLLAYKKARKATPHTTASHAFAFHLEKELLALQQQLIELSYEPDPYRYFRIYEPKERIISAASFRDRVVHHALVNVLEPVYEACFIHHSYATRKGKGSHAAIAQAQQWVRGYRCFFKADIRKYFESIQHHLLLRLLERKIKDKDIMSLLGKIIEKGGTDGKGLPIGNLTSQFLANVYLNSLDHFIKQELRVRAYIRYMDDFVLFHQDKKALKHHRRQIETFLADKLQLQLKPTACYFGYSALGLSFLGARIFAATIRIKPENLHRARKRMRRRHHQFKDGHISEKTFIHSMNSYWAYLDQFDSLGLRQNLLKEDWL